VNESSHTEQLKLIYILGFARSGTTILGNLLGEIDGFVHVGELYRLWRRAVLSKDKCGCGKRVTECELWSTAAANAFSLKNGKGQSASAQVSRAWETAWKDQRRAESNTKWRDLLLPPRNNESLKSYARLMEDVLRNVAEISGARVIVDSSKLPVSGAYAKHLKMVRPYFLHVIRDARGAVFARQRRFARSEGAFAILNPKTTVADCYRWSRSNVLAGLFGNTGRHKVLHYESFALDPAGTLRDIAAWVGERPSDLPLLDEHTARVGPNHTVSGNRNRFDTGKVKLVLDDRWKDGLRTRDYLLITALTGPLLSRYGYRLQRGSRASDNSVDHQPRT
jgi:hypothetical protein